MRWTAGVAVASGSGTDVHGHSFTLQLVGSTVVFTGQLNGWFHVIDGPPCHQAVYFGTTVAVATTAV